MLMMLNDEKVWGKIYNRNAKHNRRMHTIQFCLFEFKIYNISYTYKIKLQYFTITCIAWPQFEHFSVNTHSLSSSLMSSNTPRSTIPIWFSISCLFRDGTNYWDLRSGTGKELVLVDESEATAHIQLQNRALWVLDPLQTELTRSSCVSIPSFTGNTLLDAYSMLSWLSSK